MNTDIQQYGTVAGTSTPRRERLPDTRQSVTHKFRIKQHEGYVIVGLYPDGRPGEVFIKMAKQGSTISGLMDTIGILTSLALQYGVPPQALADKFAYMRFEPSGRTGHPELRHAHSIVDYIFRWLGITFGAGNSPSNADITRIDDEPAA